MKIEKKDLKKPFVIAGPCSAESREQMLETARGLNKEQVQLFRAGIWKPRTRPGDFEGVGKEGLAWLKEVKKETGLPVCTEVANTKHVFQALRAGVDVLWIGARTTTNPFAIQEVAEALEGVDITVMVKNPVNPDLKLWMGAIERFRAVGIENIVAIHRGFSTYEKKNYRNKPNWQIAVDLQRAFPDMVLINDPSHIGGKRAYLQEISQKAMDLNFDGLMVETHCDPSVALTDAAQQLTPAALEEMLNSLVVRNIEISSGEQDELFFLRQEINELDDELLAVLNKRMHVSERIGAFKKDNDMTILQAARWEKILEKAKERSAQSGMSVDGVAAIFKTIHQESINVQEDIMSK